MYASHDVTETYIARIKQRCAGRGPTEALHQLRVEYDMSPGHVTITERPTPCRDGLVASWSTTPIAHLSYTNTSGIWSLYRPRGDGRARRVN